MDWSRGFSSSFYMSVVDPVTWKDIDTINITQASIKHNDSNLRESADITCRDLDTTREYWVRIWLNAKQNEDIAHEALFTGLTSCPRSSISGSVREYPVECYSVLKPAEDVLLPRGYYVPAGISSSIVMKRLLRATPAPVEIADDAPALKEPIIAEGGESNLSMVDKILTAINWRIKIDGDGTINIGPLADESSITIGESYDIMELDVDIESDWYSCPNVLRAVSDSESAIARDDNPDSRFSTVTRGREIWVEETNCNLNDGETLAEYARRALDSYQSYAKTYSYRRRYIPGIYVSDLISLDYPMYDELADTDFLITSQTIDVSVPVTVSETISKW